MAKIWIGNIGAEVTDDEIKELLLKYGFPSFDSIERIPGDGSQPAVILAFNGVDTAMLRYLQPRIQGLFWKNHRLDSHMMMSGW